MNSLGVDPGMFSGFAVVDSETGALFALDFARVDDSLGGWHQVGRVLRRTDDDHTLRVWMNAVGFAAIERPFVHGRAAQNSIAQGSTYGVIKAAIAQEFGLWPVDVSPQHTKIGLTGSGNAGSKGKKGIQKSLMVAAAFRVPGFDENIDRMTRARGWTDSVRKKAIEACADALGVALYARTIGAE